LSINYFLCRLRKKINIENKSLETKNQTHSWWFLSSSS